MTTLLRIKRRTSGEPGPPSNLLGGELAFNEVDETLWYGKSYEGGTTVIPIGGGPKFILKMFDELDKELCDENEFLAIIREELIAKYREYLVARKLVREIPSIDVY